MLAAYQVRAWMALTFIMGFGWTQVASAQAVIIHPPGDQTYDCEHAIPFCNDVSFAYDPGNSTGLWFSFTVPYAQQVAVSIHGIVKLQLHPITRPENPCEGLSCNTSVGDTMSCNANPPNMSCGFNLFLQPGTYYICTVTDPNEDYYFLDLIQGDLGCAQTDCEDCLPGFMPLPGEDYVVSAWVKQVDAPLGTLNYTTPAVNVSTPGGTLDETFSPSIDRPVIEGWQLIEGRFTMPMGYWPFVITLKCSTGDCLFDDVRVFPEDGSMKCYVYDAVNLRYVAELDERHFATFYEYDNEGRLVRVKKETERGIMTIQESRQNASHVAP